MFDMNAENPPEEIDDLFWEDLLAYIEDRRVIPVIDAGSLVVDAVNASGLAARHPDLDFAALRTAVWGVARPLEHRLRDRDRVELLRGLKVDPKEARRLRYRSQRGKR